MYFRLEFKGQENEPLILCSNNKTYEVKEAETSNSLILLPEVKLFKDLKKYSSEDWRLEKAESEGVFHTYFEVKKKTIPYQRQFNEKKKKFK